MTELNPTLTLWRAVQPRVDRAIRNAADGRDGYPTGSSGGTSGSSDRTGTLATRHLETGDRNGDLHRDLERTITKLADLVDQLAPTNKAREHLGTQTDGPPGCRSCARVGGWEDIQNDSGMCITCIRLLARVSGRYDTADDMPPRDLVDYQRRGGRVTDREIDRYMHGKKRRE